MQAQCGWIPIPRFAILAESMESILRMEKVIDILPICINQGAFPLGLKINNWLLDRSYSLHLLVCSHIAFLDM